MACEADGYGFFKIGVSDCIEKRAKSVQTGCPIKIKKIWGSGLMARKIAFAIEKEIHSRLQKYHSFGEWFRFKVEEPTQKAEMNQALRDSFDLHQGSGQWFLSEFDMDHALEMAREASRLRSTERRMAHLRRLAMMRKKKPNPFYHVDY